ncbi:unnamed protein product, partial [Symbiodinium sp. CCMP2592]
PEPESSAGKEKSRSAGSATFGREEALSQPLGRLLAEGAGKGTSPPTPPPSPLQLCRACRDSISPFCMKASETTSRMFLCFISVSCPSVLRDFSPALRVASLANDRVPRARQEPIVENVSNTKIGWALVNMDR